MLLNFNMSGYFFKRKYGSFIVLPRMLKKLPRFIVDAHSRIFWFFEFLQEKVLLMMFGHELPVNMDIDQVECEPRQDNNEPKLVSLNNLDLSLNDGAYKYFLPPWKEYRCKNAK